MNEQVFNPFLPLDVYIPDGEPHVFGERIYLFGSHDREGGNTFCMLDYEFWSAPINDLSNWSSKGINYKASQDALYSKERPFMYAPDVVKGNDGKYYLYYGLSGFRGKGGYFGPISVAVCDTPDGHYEYLGYVRNKDGTPFDKFICFDSAVINDNGTIRLYYGASLPMGMRLPKLLKKIASPVFEKIYGKTKAEITADQGIWGANMVTLCDDMITVRTDACRIIPEAVNGTSFKGHAFFEGSSIRKIDETYYFIYSSQKNHELCYATSKYPDRDFVYGGTIVSNCDIGLNGRKEKDSLNAVGTTHGSIECINNQWYVFYHRLTHGSDYSRQACAEPIEISSDGSIKQVEISSCGLNGGALKAEGKYPSVIACNITNGRMPRVSNMQYKIPIPMVTHKNGERYIANIDSKTTIIYKWFNFNTPKGEILLDLESDFNGTVHIYADDECIAYIKVNDNERKEYSTDYYITNPGIKVLTFKYQGKGKINLYSFEFRGN